MKPWFALFFATFCASTSAFGAESKGVVAGYDSTDGRVLLSELNCTACHVAPEIALALAPKQAPRLDSVASHVTPQYLRRFLADPHQTKAGTTMPDLLHGLSKDEKLATVENLTHYLSSLGTPLDQRGSGSSRGEIALGGELFHTIGCVACHQPQEPPRLENLGAATTNTGPVLEGEDDEETGETPPEKVAKKSRTAIPLPPLAGKTTVDALAAFLREPHLVRPSGRMPSLSLDSAEARAIAAYLLRDQYTTDKKAPGTGIGYQVFLQQISTLATAELGKPVFESHQQEISLDQVSSQFKNAEGKALQTQFAVRFFGTIRIEEAGVYRFQTTSDDGSQLKIDDKLIVDNDGLHPAVTKQGEAKLTVGSHVFELLYYQGGGPFALNIAWQPPGAKKLEPIPGGVLRRDMAAMIPQGVVDFKVDPAKSDRGRIAFNELGCVACHAVGAEAVAASKAPKLNDLKLNTAAGCLSSQITAATPKYDLTPQQREALTSALASEVATKGKLAPRDQLHHSLKTMNCYACHQRGKVGGPEEKSDYFGYEILADLGDEGRLPPPLDLVGAKLTDAGFKDMLIDGIKYRTTMATRMPLFGEENVGHLPEEFRNQDQGKIAPLTQPMKFSEPLATDGRFLAGTKALSCINCHSLGKHRLPGAEGMDLLKVTRRIQPAYFQAWLKDPQAIRAGTRMPSGWPDGKSFFPKVQHGNVDNQINGLWAYLLVGSKGGLPDGFSVGAKQSVLRPTDEPIMFRTFLDGGSARAILVGFPQNTHFAFDANRIRSLMAWTGPFVSTDHAWSGRAGQYYKVDPALLKKFPDAPPLARLKSTENSWPRDVAKDAEPGTKRTPPGWRFRGYRLNEQRVPTFIYDVDGIRVEETLGTELRRDESVISRCFKLVSPQPVDDLYFLVAEGAKIEKKDGAFVVNDDMTFGIVASTSKPLERSTNQGEQVLLPVKFTNKDGAQVAEFQVDMTW